MMGCFLSCDWASGYTQNWMLFSYLNLIDPYHSLQLPRSRSIGMKFMLSCFLGSLRWAPTIGYKDMAAFLQKNLTWTRPAIGWLSC